MVAVQSRPLQTHPLQNCPLQNRPLQNRPLQNHPLQNCSNCKIADSIAKHRIAHIFNRLIPARPAARKNSSIYLSYEYDCMTLSLFWAILIVGNVLGNSEVGDLSFSMKWQFCSGRFWVFLMLMGDFTFWVILEWAILEWAILSFLMEWAILQFGRFYILGNFGVGDFGVGRFCHLAQKISSSKK